MIELSDREELKSIQQAIKAIDKSRLPLNKALIEDVQRVLVEKGYDAAVVHSEQAYLAADENAELVRVLTICRRYGLGQEAAAQVLDRLSRIESEYTSDQQ